MAQMLTVLLFSFVGTFNLLLLLTLQVIICLFVYLELLNTLLSYDVAVIQWLTSCHKNRMTTRYITLGYWRVTS